MLRNPQHLVLQLSVAPTSRRSLSAAASVYHSEKPPPHVEAVAAAVSPDSVSASSLSLPAFPTAPTAGLSIRSLRRMSAQSSTAAPAHVQQTPSDVRPSSSSSSSQSRRILSYFPLGYREAAQQWWSCISATTAERGVLNYVPYLREAPHAGGSEPDLRLPQQKQDAISATATATSDDPYGPRLWRSQMVALSGKDRVLNEYSVEQVATDTTSTAHATAPDETDTLVMLHGYGAGLGFFYRNFEPLSRPPGWRLFALDMLGMGNSSRPPFRVRAKDPQAKIAEAEAWFVDALEEWRRIRKIERFTLLGHSLGGYLAVSYALKYPGHLNKLILASPVGIPEDPYAVRADLPNPDASTLAAEVQQDQQTVVSASAAAAGSSASASGSASAPGKPERRPLPGWFAWLWDANVSPFTLVRASGPLGPRLVSAWTSRRFSHLPSDESEALHTYTYSLFRQRGSGEYALTHLLAPGAYARSPVIHRIQDVGRNREAGETGYPVVMMYGDHDWMDVAGGYAAQEKLKQRILQSLLHGTPEEKRQENGSAKVMIIKNAGHHLYLDNADDFNEAIRLEMDDTKKSEAKRRRQAAA